MRALNLSSNPLSTLFPNLSPQQDPNYGNAFQIDLGNLKSTTSPMPDYAKQFAEETQPMLNQMKFKVGLMTSGSSNPAIAFKGKQMVDEVVSDMNRKAAQFSSIFPTDGSQTPSFFSKIGGWQTVSAAADMLGSFMPEKDEYSGTKGDLTQTLDSTYDNIANTLMAIPGWGTLAGGIMKAGSFLGKGVNALGGGTDGMCVCAGTKVFKANGEIINIEDLKQEDGIIGWNEKTKQIVPQTIHNIIEPRQKECLEITIKSGFTLRCSMDHPVLSDNSPKARSHRINGQRIAYRDWKFRRADELKVGDFVGVANNIDYWGNITLDKAYLIGLLIGDGTYTKGNSCRLISADRSTWDYIESNGLGVINHCDDTRSDKYSTEVRTYRIIDGMNLMRQVGLVYQSGENKTLPKNIGQYTKNSICQLLAGLYDTDGSISVNEDKNNWSITLYQSNKNLLQEVKEQLHKLGIFTSISARKAAKYQLGGKIINSNQSYRLEVGDITSAIKFTQLIPLNIDYKKANLDRIYNLLKDKKAQEHPELSGAKQFKIVDIKPIGLQTVYNLQADNDHTYLANGIITHNTTTDAILGSSFLNLTPFGLINGFGGSKTNTITKDEQVFETVGSSYTGTNQTVNDALTKSGKKYGLFSSKAKDRANEEIEEAKRQQGVMSWVADEATDRFAIRDSMTAINGNRRKYYLQGGYNQADVRVGRSGMSLDLIAKAKKVLSEPRKLQTGGTAKDPFEYYVSTLPVAQRDSSNFRVRDYWQYNGQPKDFDEAKKKGMFEWVEDFDSNGKSLGWSWHAFTVAKNPNTDEYDFMKSSSHPTVQKELDWYNSNSPDAVEFRNNYELQRTEPYWKYVRRKNIQSHKEGGSIIEITSLPTEILLVDPNEVPEFQDGGRISKKIRDYYKDYNLDEITVINDSSPRTENDTIYSPSDEFTVHELWHYISQNKPNEALKEFYDSLNDNKLLQFGADLDFVKRTGDPGDFYNPSELEARLKAAKFMSQGQNYTKDFFKNLRSNENQYGDNMRDLLRMFNDDYLEKLFNVNSAQKFQEGGSINVIPEGALHARKHNMDMEGITPKGIPVISNKESGEVEQQAEIEREEIIFRLEVTKKLEELEKKFYDSETSQKEKDECALEAGKLLVEEILYNTQDNTNKLL